MKHIELNHKEWEQLQNKLVAELGARARISWVLKREFGFTVREHSRWDNTNKDWQDRRSVICIDFYDEAAKTWFALKYL
jgi:hypothetical protein